jgi:hypothetical protein
MKILSAKFGTPENTLDAGVIVETDTIGAVATCTNDAAYSGGAWDALQVWIAAGHSVADYVPPVGE